MKLFACLLLLGGCAYLPLEELEDAALYCVSDADCIMANEALERRYESIERRKASKGPDCGHGMVAYREGRGGSYSEWICIPTRDLNGIFN